MKKLLSLGLAVSLALLLSACSDNNKVEQTKEEQTSVSSSVETKESAKKEDGDFVSSANDAYFDGEYLKGNTYTIKITDHKVIQPGEAGNEYSDKPVIAFWYDTLVAPDYDNSVPVDASTAWIMNFTAIQDNDPDMVNELNIASLPDDSFLDSQSAEIKPGGTVSNAIAYELTDVETPVKLTAGSIVGDNFGEYEYQLK